MDKRFYLALLLTAIVVVLTPKLFPGASRPASAIVADSAVQRTAPAPDSGRPAISAPVAAPAQGATIGSSPTPNAVVMAPVETTTVGARLTTYTFSSRGASPIGVALDSYPSRRPGPAAGRPAQLLRPGMPLTRLSLAMGRDTVRLDTIAMQRDTRGDLSASAPVIYTGMAGGQQVRLTYQPVPDSFLVRVRAEAPGAPAGTTLLVELPRTLASNEPDSTDDMNHLAVSYHSRGEVTSVGFGKLDSGETRVEQAPINWVATRNKYFLTAFRAAPKTPFTALSLTGQPERSGMATELLATATLPMTNGTAAFDIYAGPQDATRLLRLGADLDQVNPVGGWFSGIAQPFTTIVMSSLLWMKRTTQLNYGWVLVIFGVLVRLALWPLNQGAMRTSMKMQRIQPELQAVQKRYKDDPKRQQEAIMKLYKDHGMSPLSPVIGCLPMLLPMPILFALYHVFQNTIEFRGVSFLWLPDISLYDPYFITPILMGVSMFAMSWMGMKGMPPNPQAKMMTYMMPVVLTVVFFKFAAGLNLYYAVQNIAAIPQTLLIARERAKQPQSPVVLSGPGPTVKRRS